MRRSSKTGQRLFAVFLVGGVLLNYPLLSLFSQPFDVAAVPLLYAYVFGVWILLIALMALAVERTRD
ncbi:MAG TPA: hypothetical protein VLS93_11405 [Anaeromyxobacteraceae bacterium]|nr:hypothetical protein [Anaeromyxobacteraceae bacterium]